MDNDIMFMLASYYMDIWLASHNYSCICTPQVASPWGTVFLFLLVTKLSSL